MSIDETVSKIFEKARATGRFFRPRRIVVIASLAAILIPSVARAGCQDYKMLDRIFEANTINAHYACVAHNLGFGCLIYEPPDPLNPDIGQQYLINVDNAGNKINRFPILPPETPIGVDLPTAPFVANDNGYAFVFRDDMFRWQFTTIDYDGNFQVSPKEVPISSNPVLAYNPAGFYGLYTAEPLTTRPECKVTYLTILDSAGNVITKVQISSDSHVIDCMLEHQRYNLMIIPSDEGFALMHQVSWKSSTGASFIALYANRRGFDGGAPSGEIQLASDNVTSASFSPLGINRDSVNGEYGFSYVLSTPAPGTDGNVIHARVIVDSVDPRFWWLEERLVPYASRITSTEIFYEGRSAFNGNEVGAVFRGYNPDTLSGALYFISFMQQGTLTQMPVIVTPYDTETAPAFHSIMPVEGGFAISYDKDWVRGPRAEYDNYITIIGGCPQVSPPGSEHPVKLVRNGGNVNVSWEEGEAGENYNLYEGNLPSFTRDFNYDHVPAVCHTTGTPSGVGELSEIIPLRPGSNYYLVSSSNGTRETSLGFSSDGKERPNDFPCGP